MHTQTPSSLSWKVPTPLGHQWGCSRRLSNAEKYVVVREALVSSERYRSLETPELDAPSA